MHDLPFNETKERIVGATVFLFSLTHILLQDAGIAQPSFVSMALEEKACGEGNQHDELENVKVCATQMHLGKL